MSGGVRLSGGPVLSEPEISNWESEASSIIDIGDRCLPSESEDELADKQKYRLPDAGKTRLNLLTKEPLSPSRRVVPQSPSSTNRNKMATPTTPRSDRFTRQASSPSIHRMRMGSSENVNTLSDGEYFASDISRAGSIYSLSRVSFAGQIARLTNIRLPDASSLVKRISSIPTASEAAKTLSDASEQIHVWIAKASEVLQGLSADGDVEWAAAGGRDGVDEADQAIDRFDKLVDVYVLSIERLQTRDDAGMLSAAELTGSVKQMETIMASWSKIKAKLKDVKGQVQLAVDWETLWNKDLGEIAQEMGELNRHIFELEEKRHHGAEQLFGANNSADLMELETLLEEEPSSVLHGGLATTDSPLPRLTSMIDDAESLTLGLSARMQPLRTSLDFLPMKLSTFHARAQNVFPAACKELQDRRDELEAQWVRMEKDARSLRDELGEDKWIMIFRNAGKQAASICDSIDRSLMKLKTALEMNEHVLNRSATTRKIENYEAKKMHYTPAIDRMLSIIERGVNDRLTINGDVLRRQAQLQQRWIDLQSRMKLMDNLLVDLSAENHDQPLRDSVSTILSSEKSMLSSLRDTPATSPAASVVGASRKSSFHGSTTPTQASGVNTPSTAGRATDRRLSSSIPRRSGLFFRSSIADFRSSPSPVMASSSSSTTHQWPSRPPVKDERRPKWNASTKADKRDFAPLSQFEPSPYAKRTVGSRLQSHTSKSGTSRTISEPFPQQTPKAGDGDRRRLELLVPQTPDRKLTSALTNRISAARLSVTPLLTGRRSRLSMIAGPANDGNDADIDVPARSTQRPLSSLERSSRRSSIIPMRGKADIQQAVDAAKPKWR